MIRLEDLSNDHLLRVFENARVEQDIDKIPFESGNRVIVRRSVYDQRSRESTLTIDPYYWFIERPSTGLQGDFRVKRALTTLESLQRGHVLSAISNSLGLSRNMEVEIFSDIQLVHDSYFSRALIELTGGDIE